MSSDKKLSLLVCVVCLNLGLGITTTTFNLMQRGEFRRRIEERERFALQLSDFAKQTREVSEARWTELMDRVHSIEQKVDRRDKR